MYLYFYIIFNLCRTGAFLSVMKISWTLSIKLNQGTVWLKIICASLHDGHEISSIVLAAKLP